MNTHSANPDASNNEKVVLITGSSHRIGAQIARTLHEAGFKLILHYRDSKKGAEQLAADLNLARSESAALIQGELSNVEAIERIAQTATSVWGRVDALINNASTFYPTPLGTGTGDDWDKLFNSNAKGPFFLSQALAPELKKNNGNIINIVDIYSEKPLKDHTIYCMAKAALNMMTKSLARELAPIRVNGVSPGAILWPETDGEITEQSKQAILEKVPLGTTGQPSDIANTVKFLLCDGPYINGQIIAVDGGRSTNI